MSDISMQTVVTGPAQQPGNKPFRALYRQEFDALSPQALDYFIAEGKKIEAYVTKASANKDAGDLTATMNMSIDGKDVPTISVTGISRREVVKFQRMLVGLAKDLVDIAEKHAGK